MTQGSMRTALLLSTALFLAACDKPEAPPAAAPTSREKNPAPSAPAPSPSPSAAVTAPATTPPQPPPPPPTQEELDAYFADLDSWQKDADQLLAAADSDLATDLKPMQSRFADILKRRAKLTAGMTMEQRKEIALQSAAAQKKFAEIQRRRIGRSLQNIPRPPSVPAGANPPPAEGTPPAPAEAPAPPP